MPDSQEFDLELALDRIQAQLDGELRSHVRAFAAAYARGEPPPAAPDLAGRASTAAVGKRSLGFASLRTRGAQLLRIVAPVMLERDAGVVAARSVTPTWAAWAALADARDAVAVARFGRRYVDVMHLLAGAREVVADASATIPPRLEAWHAREEPLSSGAVEALWEALTALDEDGPPRSLAIIPSDVARPRFFVEDRGSCGTAVVPRVIDTPAKRFEVLHELGHAWCALASSYELPRAVDEAGAARIARLMEIEGALPPGWFSPVAEPARARRLAIARALDAIERRLVPPPASLAAPPWALWHDPGAQAAYVRAEAIADELARTPLADVAENLGLAAVDIDAAVEL